MFYLFHMKLVWVKVQLPETVHANAKSKAAKSKTPFLKWVAEVLTKAAK